MIAVQLTRAFQVHGDGDFEQHTDELMDELLKLESDTIRDVDVAGSLTERCVEISVYAIGEDFDAATELADAAIRTAIHAANGHTPDWVAIRKLVDMAELVPA